MSLKGKDEAVAISRGGNRLIDGLPARQRHGFLSQCESVELASGTVLCEAGEPFDYAYFPIAGNISLVSALVGHESFEAESIGNEGMLGTALVLDINLAPQRGVVQTPCLTLRIKAKRLQTALQRYPALCRTLQRYQYAVLVGLSQTTGCIHFHDAGARLARCLLLAHDRARIDPLPLTHQQLAGMLGVQRGAVTIAALKLQGEGIIRYRRGKISILDRTRLEVASCSCYGASIENYASILS